MAETAAWGWSLAATLAAVLLAQTLQAGRRRTALNRALHEVRRPLQAMALAGPGPGPTGAGAGSLRLAIAALAQLDAELNRCPPPDDHAPAPCAELLEGAAMRWRRRAALAGKSIELRNSVAGGVLVAAPTAVGQAVDNLIVNALEHGGAAIVVDASRRGERVRIRVADDGQGLRRRRRHGLARLGGRRRHGHGLDVVRRLAAAHGGRFALRRSERETVAHLELPVLAGGDVRAA